MTSLEQPAERTAPPEKRGRWIAYFSDPSPGWSEADERRLLGGKGASLKAMTRMGLHVPPGFTVVTEACRQVLASNDVWPDGLDAELRTNMARLERDTGRAFGRAACPLLVSVRSGAAVSMPGMMDTLLNCGLHPGLANDASDTPWFWLLYGQFIRSFARTVHGLGEEDLPTQPPTRHGIDRLLADFRERTGHTFPSDPWDALTACVNAVFRSWHSERARVYRRRHGIDDAMGTAVNVQAMFSSEVSGVAFTLDPTDPTSGHLVIEASYGLGESIVSGDVTPDRYLVRRDDLTVVSSKAGHKTNAVPAFGPLRKPDTDGWCLTEKQIGELAGLALRVERSFEYPADIEWGWAEGRFALLQVRPIRGCEVAREVERARGEEVERIRVLSEGRRCVWVAHNLDETLHSPTPLTWDIVRRFMCGAGGFGRLYRTLGYRPGRRVCESGFLELLGGRIYADPVRAAELFWEAMPLRYDIEGLKRDRTLLDRAPDTFEPDRADGRFLFRLPGNLLRLWGATRRVRRMRATGRQRFEGEILPPFLEYVRAERNRDLRALSDRDVAAVLEERRSRVLDEFAPESLLPSYLGAAAFAEVEGLLCRLLGDEEGKAMARTLTQGLEGDFTVEQSTMLHEVAAGDGRLDAFLARFGHRAVGEMELSVPRWREDPDYLIRIVAQASRGRARPPAEVHRGAMERRLSAQAGLPDLLARCGGSSFGECVERCLAQAHSLLPYRENGKYYLMMGYELLRLAIEELGRRWSMGRDIYFLRLDELGRCAEGDRDSVGEIPARKLRWQALQQLELPDAIDSTNLNGFGRPVALQCVESWTGTPLATGSATGSVRIVKDPRHAEDLGAGYVLVCSSTDPGWTPLFAAAAALVVERGGTLSHGAIVARDFGIPAVCCAGITRALADGDKVRVDGTSGQVSVLQRQEPAG